MNAPNLQLVPEVLIGPQRADQPALPLASEGVQRYVWKSAFGPMLIEVRDGAAFVNGQRVTSMAELHSTVDDRPPQPPCTRPLGQRGSAAPSPSDSPSDTVHLLAPTLLPP